MGIEDVKRWQWILVGLLIGFGMGWVWSGTEAGTSGRLISQFNFERELTGVEPNTRKPLIVDIVIGPVTTDYQNKSVQPVSLKRLQQGARSGKIIYTDAEFIASVPYKPTFNGAGVGGANYTVKDYLEGVAKRNPAVKYRYGWYEERPAAIAMWTIGATVIIGGIWPTLLNMMVGAGLGGVREKKAKEEDYFSRFSHEAEPEKAKAALAVSEADRDRLDDMNEALERDLAGAGIATTTDTPEGAAAAAEVRKLEGGPLEVAPAMKKPGDDDEIEVKGEYYPVLIHHHKKQSDHTDETDEMPDQKH